MAKAGAVLVVGLVEKEVELVKATAHRVILFHRSIEMDLALAVDVPVEMDLNDEERVIAQALKLAQRFEIAGVYTLNEYRVPLAARIAEALGLSSGLSYEAALNCRSKRRTREHLSRAGLGSARFAVAQSPEAAVAVLADLPLPVVVKPSDEAGSNLVARCDTSAAVEEAARAILAVETNWVGQTRVAEILIEEYLDGPEYSVETCTVQGESTVLAITAKQTTPPPHNTEIGHTVPANLTDEVQGEVTELVKAALAAVGVNNAVTHTEVKLTARGPRIIEINARPGGDRISTLMRLVTGYDLQELALHVALGKKLDEAPRHEPVSSSAAIRFVAASTAGVVGLNDPTPLKEQPGVHEIAFTVKAGDRVGPTTCNYDRLGHLIVYGTGGRHADQVAEGILQQLSVTVSS